MYKVITLFVIFGCTFAAPTPRVGNQRPLNRSDSISRNNENVIKEMEFSLGEIDTIFKRLTPGNNQRQGFHPDNEVEHPPFNDGDFIRPSSQEDLSNGQARDPYVGTEEAAARAVNSPLFFDTFDHGHMVTSYAERRQSPLLFRSIRPDFPFSDVSNRRLGRPRVN